MGHLLWKNFVFMTLSIFWLIYARRNPNRMMGRYHTSKQSLTLILAPWILGAIALANGILWIFPLFHS